MIFKKPYAFFIKYFRLINFILVMLLSYFGYKLYSISDVFKRIYNNTFTNYSSLNSDYIGFKLFFVVFVILIILTIILLLLKNKKKPLKDYLFYFLYVVILLFYLIYSSNVFYVLSDSIIEPTTLKLYSDISFLITLPSLYFLFKFILVVIGFNLKKFDFTNDIIELKQDENDSEEIEIIFDKHTYKYKRKINKTIRELKYYFLENKLFITIIGLVTVIILFVLFFSFNIFKTNVVKINESFVAGNISYTIRNAYQTQYNFNNKIIKKDSKFIIVSMTVSNILNEAQSINFERIRLLFGDQYVYSNNYYNKYFYDLGDLYNGEMLLSGESKDYLFVFEVPLNVKKKKYEINIYDRVVFEDEQLNGKYIKSTLKPNNLDKKFEEVSVDLNNSIVFDKDKYKNSKLVLSKYSIQNNFIYNNGLTTKVYRDKDINKQLLIVDYKLDIDDSSLLKDYIKNNDEFFNKFSHIEYNYNDKTKSIKSNVIGIVDGKVLLSVSYELDKADNINLALSFRNKKIKFKLK